MNGLSVINIELTSRCNKKCWMCGRRKIEESMETDWGDMEYKTLINIANQVPRDVLIQFHNNGEPLLYPHLKQALSMFPDNIRCLNTNGKLLLEKADDIIGRLDTITISVIENDPEEDEQYKIVCKFLQKKGSIEPPFMVYRLLGDIKGEKRWYDLPGLVAKRILHSPMGSFDYTKPVTIPEHGICLDLLSHLVIDRYGDVYPCVRFNPFKYNKLGNVNETSLEEMWNSTLRRRLIKKHMEGKRQDCKLCDKCKFYGVPRGGN